MTKNGAFSAARQDQNGRDSKNSGGNGTIQQPSHVREFNKNKYNKMEKSYLMRNLFKAF